MFFVKPGQGLLFFCSSPGDERSHKADQLAMQSVDFREMGRSRSEPYDSLSIGQQIEYADES